MSRRCIVSIISIWIFLYPSFSRAQDTTPFDTAAFYNYLKDGNLLLEQLTFNQKLQKVYADNKDVTDSLQLDRAVIFMKLNKSDQVNYTLKKIPCDLNVSERNRQLFISMLIVTNNYAAVECALRSANDNGNKVFYKEVGISMCLLKRQLCKMDTSAGKWTVSPTLGELKDRYINIPRHSPFLSGLYSALLPGSGKLYVGNKFQAMTAFVANMLLGMQAVESYIKAGPGSPRFILTASLFGVFYTGNIWGSVALAKKKKIDYLSEIDHEIFTYYNANIKKFTE